MNDVVEIIYLAAFNCNTLLCRFREEEIVVVFVIFITMMKRVSIFIRVICNNRQLYFDIYVKIKLSIVGFPLNYFLAKWQESRGGWWAIHFFFDRKY